MSMTMFEVEHQRRKDALKEETVSIHQISLHLPFITAVFILVNTQLTIVNHLDQLDLDLDLDLLKFP